MVSFSRADWRCFATALLWAASLAPGFMCESLDSRQLDWLLMIVTASLLLSWLRIKPRSLSLTGRPSFWETILALDVAKRDKRRWKSWETSPYWPATRETMSPNSLRRCCKGPMWSVGVPKYFSSTFFALSRYSLCSPFALWSTVFLFRAWYQVSPALIPFSSASWSLAGPCSFANVIFKSGQRPSRSLAYGYVEMQKNASLRVLSTFIGHLPVMVFGYIAVHYAVSYTHLTLPTKRIV